MGIYEFGEPDQAAYVRYVAGFCLRYFAVAGGLCWFFHVWGRGDWLPYRIQQSFPGRRELAHEIRWSMSNAVCTGASTLFLLRLVRDGHTRMYFDAMDRGWAYFALSVLLGVAGYDAWFYWQHRLLHTRWLFRQAHVIHHRVTNPTPFATFAHHPVETFLGNAFFILFLTAVPMHPAALALVGSAIVAFGIVAHLGYELYPTGFTRHGILGWLNTATHHNMHHSEVRCNYGLALNWWDRWMGTNHPAYLATFDAMKARVVAASVFNYLGPPVVARDPRTSSGDVGIRNARPVPLSHGLGREDEDLSASFPVQVTP